MGACCSGKGISKLDKNIKTEEDKNLSMNRNNFSKDINELDLNLKKFPSFKTNMDNSSISKNLNYILKKFMLSDQIRSRKIKIRNLTIEELWNISKFYKHDHTKSTHIICDFRKHSNKIENFLKLFRTVNYNSIHFSSLNDTIFFQFHKHISDKNLIIIPDEENIFSIENFIKRIIDLKIKTNLLIFNYDLKNDKKIDDKLKEILQIMDFEQFFELPFIFMNLKYFPHLEKDGFIFLDFLKKNENKVDNKIEVMKNFKEKSPKKKNKTNEIFQRDKDYDDGLLERKYDENNIKDKNYLDFASNFKIGLILKINFNKKSDNRNELLNNIEESLIKRNLISNNKINRTKKNFDGKNDKDLSSKYDYTVKSFQIKNLSNLKDLIKKKEKILEFFDYLKFEISQNKSMLIKVPSDIDLELLIGIFYLVIWKISNIKPFLLTNYIRRNFYYYYNCEQEYNGSHPTKSSFLEKLSKDSLKKINKFLSLNFNVPEASDLDLELEYNDYIFPQDTDKNEFKLKIPSYRLNDSSFEKQRSSINKVNNIYENYFSLPLKLGKEEIKKDITDLEYHSDIRKQLSVNLNKLNNIDDKKFLFDILSTLEKIIGNLINNSEDRKFWNIKTESSKFKRCINSSENALQILDLAGFKLTMSDGHKYYTFNQLVSIEVLKVIIEEITFAKNSSKSDSEIVLPLN